MSKTIKLSSGDKEALMQMSSTNLSMVELNTKINDQLAAQNVGHNKAMTTQSAQISKLPGKSQPCNQATAEAGHGYPCRTKPAKQKDGRNGISRADFQSTQERSATLTATVGSMALVPSEFRIKVKLARVKRHVIWMWQ